MSKTSTKKTGEAARFSDLAREVAESYRREDLEEVIQFIDDNGVELKENPGELLEQLDEIKKKLGTTST